MQKNWNPDTLVFIWEYSARALQWIPTRQCLRLFSKHSESSCRVASALEGLRVNFTECAGYTYHPAFDPAAGLLLQEVEEALPGDDGADAHLLHVRDVDRGRVALLARQLLLLRALRRRRVQALRRHGFLGRRQRSRIQNIAKYITSYCQKMCVCMYICV